MILKRALKQVIVGAVALTYLQKARGAVDKDISKIKAYWANKVICMSKELEMRNNFFDEVQPFISQEKKANVLKNRLEQRKEDLSSIKINLLFLSETVEKIQKTADEFMELDKTEDSSLCWMEISSFKPKTDEIKTVYGTLLNMLPIALRQCDTAAKEIKSFDSNMMETIYEFRRIKKMPGNLNDLDLFNLADNNKPLAISIIYSLFRTEPYEQGADTENALAKMNSRANTYQFALDFAGYTQAIRKSVEEGDGNLLELASKHFPLLFKAYSINEEIMSIYMDLVKEDLSKNKIRKYKSITPEQIIKVLMVECAMNGRLMDYRQNNVFFNLGRIIMNIGTPADDSTDVQKDLKAAKEKQNEILNVLHILWNAADAFHMEIQEKNIDFFCKQNNVSAIEFKNLQNSFIAARWMYKLYLFKPLPEKLTSKDAVYRKVHFDMSYIHPICYIYQRCMDIDHLAGTDANPSEEPFIKSHSQGFIVIRPHKVSKKDNNSVRIKNVKDCIRQWFFCPRIKIVVKGEECEQYYNILQDFRWYMDKSQYMFSKVEKKEKTEERAETERNPLQDGQTEIEKDGFVLVN
ncbi:hypothetical protein NEMIN01_0359 [Nematocida minor]|uniref:uncharacterized protein n=1 Tax=Nematocida minor TaxID=1912983 RepID=UPI00221ED43F|nr:uncharacterized protein NEMIN01_0359 [Nematocida minor]KAI5189193.1 hypothetical protein NEMIN01_0359 [Nematocida minor]